jgi:hypothetical protein
LRWLAAVTGRTAEDLVSDLGPDGIDAIEHYEKERSRSPGGGYSPLHFLKFPNYVQLADKNQADLTKLGTPPPGWVKAFNRQNGDLVRYRNAVHHATRFDQLPPKERREAVQLFAEQLQHLKDWWPEHPYQEQEPRLEENPLVTALQELSHDPRSAGPLVRELGFTPVNNPTDLIGPGSTSQLAVDLRGDVDRLFRVGQKTFGSAGAVAVYVAYLSLPE